MDAVEVRDCEAVSMFQESSSPCTNEAEPKMKRAGDEKSELDEDDYILCPKGPTFTLFACADLAFVDSVFFHGASPQQVLWPALLTKSSPVAGPVIGCPLIVGGVILQAIPPTGRTQ